MTNDTTDAKGRAEKLAAFRSDHVIVPVDEAHELFGTIHRCQHCSIRVHWITRQWRHDADEIVDLLQEEYGGSFGQPKDRAIERIVSLYDPATDDESEFVDDTDRESMPEFNGAFR